MNKILSRYSLALIMAVAVFPSTVRAQNAPPVVDKEIKVEVKDGQVFVNGQQVDKDDQGEYWIEDGEGGREMVWQSDDGNRTEYRVQRRLVDRDRGESMRRFMVERDFEDSAPGALLRERMMNAPAHPGSPMFMPRRLRERSDADRQGSEEIRQMERETRDLAAQAREASGKEKQDLLAQLDRKLEETFDRKLSHEREILERQEKKLEEQRDRLARRGSSRADIIRRHRANLLGERDGLDW